MRLSTECGLASEWDPALTEAMTLIFNPKLAHERGPDRRRSEPQSKPAIHSSTFESQVAANILRFRKAAKRPADPEVFFDDGGREVAPSRTLFNERSPVGCW